MSNTTERESKAKSITYITVLSSTKISQPWAGHEMVWKTQKGHRRNSGYPGFASQGIPRQQISLQSIAKGVPCLSHHIQVCHWFFLPQPRHLHQPQRIPSRFTPAEPAAPKPLGFGFSLSFFWVFLNFTREDSPPSLQYIEFPEISHEMSWDFYLSHAFLHYFGS